MPPASFAGPPITAGVVPRVMAVPLIPPPCAGAAERTKVVGLAPGTIFGTIVTVAGRAAIGLDFVTPAAFGRGIVARPGVGGETPADGGAAPTEVGRASWRERG